MKTVFLDIDGVILTHPNGLDNIYEGTQELISGTLEKLSEWTFKNYNIILTTARPESLREYTIKQLEKFHIVYDVLLMGINHGQRVIINDSKPDSINDTAIGITVPRNQGIQNINI